MLLQPTWLDIAVAAAFGAVVAGMRLAAGRSATLQMVLPVFVAFAVAYVTFVLARHGWLDADLRAMIAPLVTFLPGAALSMAVVEMSAGDMVSGASRLVSGMLQLLLLVFGIVAAGQVAGVPATGLTTEPQNLLGWWAPWLGVLLVGVGDFLFFSAPRDSLRWLWLVLYVAWIGQVLGNEIFGGYLSGFFGALAMTPVAYAVARLRS